jgi:hypothetical protein
MPCYMAQEFLAKDSLDDLVALLIKGKIADKLLEFLPPIRRTDTEFANHFNVSGRDAAALTE